MKPLGRNLCTILVLTACHLPYRAQAQQTAMAVTDHHVHLMSPELIALWKNMGIPFSKPDSYYENIDTILAMTQAQGISLISMAYVFASGEFGDSTMPVEALLQNENDYLAAAKAAYPDRIKAYYGIDPLHPNALKEVARCQQDLALDGIKMHFNASQVYLTEPTHLKPVKAVFEYAAQHHIPILLHFDNGHPKFGRTDVMLLADSILAGLDYVNLQIAHFGTSGGFTDKTNELIQSFNALFQSGHSIAGQHITFDISAVCLDKETEGIAPLTETELAALASLTRELGFDKIVFGSDYPLYTSQVYLDVLRLKLHLSPEEMNALLQEKHAR